MSPWLARLFPWPFLAVGFVALAFGVRGARLAWASPSWPTAKGRIVSSEVSSSASFNAQSTHDATNYHARILYCYTVDGRPHESKRVAFGECSSRDRSQVERIVARYPVGTEVEVSYSPDTPSTSVLEPGMKGQALFLPLCGAAFASVGTAMLLFLPGTGVTRRRRTRAKGGRSEPASARNPH